MNPPGALLFVSFGATELFFVLVLFVLLFGVDKLPEMARTLGRLQAQWNRARREVSKQLKTPLELEADAARVFESRREAQIRQTHPGYQEEIRLREAARVLGVPGAETMDVPRLKREIQARTGEATEGSGRDAEG